MKIVFWIGLAWLVYVYFGYAVLIWIIGFVRHVKSIARDDVLPSVSVLIAARNEEKDIGWKIAETLRWQYPEDRLEVLVASDASEDRTEQIVGQFVGARVTLVRLEKRGGKNVALNQLVQLARGELLFFTDANAHISADCLRRITRHFTDERVGCVSGHSIPVSEGNDHAIGTGAGVYLRYEDLVNRLEDRVGSLLVCDGAIFCIRRKLFSPLTPDLANDLELPMRIANAGFWTRYEATAVATERDTPSPREESSRRRRISGQGFLAMGKLRKTLLGLRGWQFISRKFLRWLTPIPLLLVLVASILLSRQPIFLVLLCLQIMFYVLALFGWRFVFIGRNAGPVVSVPFYALLGSLSAIVGVVDVCRGRHFSIWDIPALSRGQGGTGLQKVQDVNGAPPRDSILETTTAVSGKQAGTANRTI